MYISRQDNYKRGSIKAHWRLDDRGDNCPCSKCFASLDTDSLQPVPVVAVCAFICPAINLYFWTYSNAHCRLWTLIYPSLNALPSNAIVLGSHVAQLLCLAPPRTCFCLLPSHALDARTHAGQKPDLSLLPLWISLAQRTVKVVHHSKLNKMFIFLLFIFGQTVDLQSAILVSGQLLCAKLLVLT